MVATGIVRSIISSCLDVCDSGAGRGSTGGRGDGVDEEDEEEKNETAFIPRGPSSGPLERFIEEPEEEPEVKGMTGVGAGADRKNSVTVFLFATGAEDSELEIESTTDLFLAEGTLVVDSDDDELEMSVFRFSDGPELVDATDIETGATIIR
jgi:hypothetical protein